MNNTLNFFKENFDGALKQRNWRG